MYKNYLKIAWRNIQKNKTFSLINIVGLSIVLSASFVIAILVYYDLTFDKFHVDSDRIYRVTTEFTSPEGSFYNPGVSVPLAQALKEGVPEVEISSPFYTNAPYKVENRETDKVFMQPENVIYCDTGYFEIFKYPWLVGDEKMALSRPNEVVLTVSRAQKYFPNIPPNELLGRTLIYNDTIPASITGIIENFKERSDLVFEEFVSIKTLGTAGHKSILGDDG